MSETNIKYVEECDNDHRLDNSEDNAGKFISIMVLRGFYRPYVFEDVFSDEGLIKELKGEDEYGDTITSLCRASTVGADSMLTSDIYNAYVTSGKGFMNFKKNRDYYVMEYHFGISTVVGVIVLLLLVNFCIDTGTRMVKLSFLQLIAPIPIVSYIDPASGKNGIFMKWIKEVGKTWIGLFIRLLAIFFAISIIQHVDELQSVGMENGEASIWVQIFVIIGALIFAKQLPDLIQNITGIKMEGGFNLNPFKKIENEALGGKFIANTSRGAIMAGANAAVSGVGQLASNGYNFFKTQSNLKKAIAKETDEGKKAKLERQLKQMHAGRFMVTSLGGTFRGSTRGLKSGFTSGRKGDYHVFKNAKEDIAKGNKSRDNLANVHKYNSEIKYRAKQDKQAFLDEHGVKKKKELSAEEKAELKAKMKDYKEQRYGFVERNIGERLDQWAGVKNEYGGVGSYSKKISDLDRDISNYESKETGMRNALSMSCANHSINQTMVEDYHKEYKKNSSKITDEFNNKISTDGQRRYNAKVNNESEQRCNEKMKDEVTKKYNEKAANESEERYNEKVANEKTERYNEKVANEGATRYIEKENEQLNERKEKKKKEKENKYKQILSEEYDRLLKENGGSRLTNEQDRQFEQFKADKKKLLEEEDIETEVKQELRQEVEDEIRQEVENEITQEVQNEIRQEVENEIRQEAEDETRQEIGDKIRQEVEAEIRQEVEAEILKEAEDMYLSDVYKQMKEQYGIDEADIRRQHKLVQTQLEDIDIIDDKAKQARKEKKEFTELLSARESAEKK